METKENFYSVKNILTLLYQVIEPYYDLLIINNKFRWLFLRLIVELLIFSSFSGTIGVYFSEIALLSLIESKSGGSSGFALGGVYLCYALPPIMLMLITGGIADFFDKRKIMVIADLIRSVLALLNLLVLINVERFKGFFYVILFLSVSCSAFFDPCREGFVPFIVPREKLTASSAIDALTWMTCTFIGGSIGGLVTATLGYYWNFTLNSVTFLFSSLFVAQLFRFPELTVDELRKKAEQMDKEEKEEMLKNQESTDEPIELKENETDEKEETKEIQSVEKKEIEQKMEEEKETSVDLEPSNLIYTENSIKEEELKQEPGALEAVKSFLTEMFLGIKYLIKNPYALSLVGIKGTFVVAYIFMDFLTIKFADGQFKIGDNPSAMLGITKALLGISAGLTPVLLERLIKPTVAKMRFIIFCTSCLSFFAFILLYWSPNVVVYLIGIFISGPVIGVPWVFSTAMIQRTVPKELIGRIIVMDYGFFMNITQLISIFTISVSIDIIGFNVYQLALMAAIFGGCMSVYYGIWCFITRNYE
eukprot:gene2323-2791_t